jgi:hypothetical protein
MTDDTDGSPECVVQYLAVIAPPSVAAAPPPPAPDAAARLDDPDLARTRYHVYDDDAFPRCQSGRPGHHRRGLGADRGGGRTRATAPLTTRSSTPFWSSRRWGTRSACAGLALSSAPRPAHAACPCSLSVPARL